MQAPSISKHMGTSFLFKIKYRDSSIGNKDLEERDEKIQMNNAIKKVMTGCQMFKQPEIKFPYAPHRAAGRIKPCLVARHKR